MSVPQSPISLVVHSYKKIFPIVHKEIDYWKKQANEIPNKELRKQALASIDRKLFHCEGGAILALLAEDYYDKVIPFIVAYQTISDYLDNLCDRSTSQNPDDFAALHEAMIHALTPGAKTKDYYRYRDDFEDGGYLTELVATCQTVLKEITHYPLIKENLWTLCHYYCDLQVHKHVIVDERVPRLQNWFAQNEQNLPDMEWYEFSACTGSTLGIFCLVSYAMREDFTEKHGQAIINGYFPYIQGLHILLDYFIDQEEDLDGGDLNFCSYYENNETLFNRLQMFLREADRHTEQLPNEKFHQLINRGLLGIYLSDSKLNSQHNVRKIAKKLIKYGGSASYFFYINCKAYRKLQAVFR
ncbi:tetraprenyl-beta-curcumene synthase family protein [Caldibacillus lycopersici]|uniref:Tetraprenyl-beta-curcumene synthase family protein n=1 Tax=Perspicuibacillus lycopersici TaxID=1325689 RepID=A0AAE3ITT7_9BACI|nr:tetraprenyl-beta-curcumene synthase family protein [Perspicuibacillus lycopersici]MCU9614272.1 tetraprenyl-beta-curcumene synthase family protein [Perspicuibacillus lycopersici]